jgi:cytochrome c-type biogenesis protein CcmH
MGKQAAQPKTGSKGLWGVLALGLALAAVVAALAWRGIEDKPEPPSAQPSAEAGSIAALEARVAQDPADGAAWQALGFARFQDQRYDGAAEAYAKAAALDPSSAVLWSALGEARVMASQRDPMPPAALNAFRKAAALDARDPRARYFLAVNRDLGGDHRGALADWLVLLRDTPPGAPWEADLVRTIDQVGKINKLDTAPQLAAADRARKAAFPETAGAAPGLTAGRAIPGPSQDQLRAASAMTPGQQREMAEGMVASLEVKLAADPSNIEGWAMLMRSRQSLGQTDRARKALADAKVANPGAAQRLDAEAGVVGIR